MFLFISIFFFLARVVACEDVLYSYYRHLSTPTVSNSVKNFKVFQNIAGAGPRWRWLYINSRQPQGLEETGFLSTLSVSNSGKFSKVSQSCCKSFGSKGLRLAPGAGPDISPYGIRVYDFCWQGMQIPDFAGISATTFLHFLHFLSTMILTIFLMFFITVLYPVCFVLSTPIWGFFVFCVVAQCSRP